MNLTVLTPPAVEPVTVAEAKVAARINFDDDDNDANIVEMITTARQTCETITRRAFITTTFMYSLDRLPLVYPYGMYPFYSLERLPIGTWGRIHLPRPPLQEVTSFTYVDTLGTRQTLDPSQYTVRSGGNLEGQITPAYGLLYPTARVQLDSVEITYRGGYGDDPSDVPAGIKQAIKLLVRQAYWAQADESVDATMTAVKRLLAPYQWGAYK